MKKVITVLLALVLCISAFSVTASAAETDAASLGVSSAVKNRGETVTLTVNMVANPGLAGMDLVVSYDETRLEKVSYEGVASFGGHWTIDNHLIWDVGAVDSTATGAILTLTFKVKDDAPYGFANVTVSGSAGNNKGEYGERVTLNGATGQVEIPEPPCNHANKKINQGDDEYHWYDCDCGTTGINKAKHEFGAWAKVDDAKHAHTCSVCQKPVEAPHNWDAGKVTTAATCVAEGVKTYTCSDCGATKTEKIDIDLTAHSMGKWVQTKAPTCTEAGVETRNCDVCGKAPETREVAAKGHSYGAWTVTTKPTCTEKGVETRECACGEKETRDVAALGHNWILQEEGTVKPTSSKDGVKAYKCSRCGATKTEVWKYSKVPSTGDITPVLYMGGFGAFAMLAAAAYVLKRKFAR